MNKSDNRHKSSFDAPAFPTGILAIALVICLMPLCAFGQVDPESGLAQPRKTGAIHSRGTRVQPLVSTPTFQDTDYPVGNTPYAVAAGDFNGDGNLDVVSANSYTDTVSVPLGNGDGTFQAHVDYTVGNAPSSVVVGDFNGDGKLDIAVWNASNGTMSVLLGNGDGTFQSQIVTNLGPSGEVDVMAVGDFNKDGKLDLTVTSFGGYTQDAAVRVLLGNGDGTFQAPTSYSVGLNSDGTINPVDRATSVAAASLRNNAKLDLIVTVWNSNGAAGGAGSIDKVAVLLGNGDGTFVPVNPSKYYNVDEQPGELVVADFNGDGKLDLATVNVRDGSYGYCEDPSTVSVLLGNGDGAPTQGANRLFYRVWSFSH